MKRDEVYLGHILDAIQQIDVYVAGVDQGRFNQDRMMQDAVVRQLGVIGEASRRLSKDFRHVHHEIPWQAIVSMRNRIAHDYLNIDLQIVWEVVQHDLPRLKSFVEKALG